MSKSDHTDSRHLDEKLMEHLSNDISTSMNFITSHRIRMAFTILVGPFVLLGSFFVGLRGRSPNFSFDIWDAIAAVTGVLSMVGWAIYGAIIDQRTLDQCNQWRRALYDLRMGNIVNVDQLEYKAKLIRYYLPASVLVLTSFVALAFLLLRRLDP